MWKYIAASATGRSHLLLGQVCQDRFTCSVAEGGWLIAAVADGAGSAAFAEVGAEIAVKTAASELAQALAAFDADPEATIRAAVASARRAVLEASANAAARAREYASTLLVVAVGPNGGAAAQIGDGVIAVREASGDWMWVFWPQRGEYANVTRFLIEDDALDALEIAPLRKDICELSLLTDGLEPLALHYETRAAHSPFFEGMARELRRSDATGLAGPLSTQLETFLRSSRISERVDDDVTLVLATRP